MSGPGTRSTTMNTREKLALIASPLVAIVVLWGAVQLMDLPKRQVEAKLELGLTAAEVVERLGEPNHVHHADTAPEDYYVEGWARRERPITSTVQVFILGEPICYVWYDEEGLVEDWFLGGS